MVKLIYGDQEILVDEYSMDLTSEQLKILLDGKFVIETGIPSDKSDKIRKIYYLGVLFDIFSKNYHPAYSKREIYAMIFNAYPVFLKLRQAETLVAEYNHLKEKHNVFARIR